MDVILGIDPGSQRTGYGLLKWQPGAEPKLITFGVIELPSRAGFSHKLFYLSQQLETLYREYQPSHTVVEKVFLGKNADSAFKLGHVRGVCFLEACKAQSAVSEFAARKVKKLVTGYGAAAKEQVRHWISSLFKVQKEIPLDASDALSLALAYCQNERGSLQNIKVVEP